MMYHGWSLIIFAVVLPFLVLIAGLLFAQSHPGDVDPERVLAARLARGEIELEDYEQRLNLLRAGRRQPWAG